jgi:hypothetical protein
MSQGGNHGLLIMVYHGEKKLGPAEFWASEEGTAFQWFMCNGILMVPWWQRNSQQAPPNFFRKLMMHGR